MTVNILNPGLLTTIQDLGRYGAQKYGVIVSGAMDRYSLRLANILVGNDEGEGALEVTLFGTSLQFESDQLISITGGNLNPVLDGEKAPMWRPVFVRKGSILTFNSGKAGTRAYIAFAGGILIPQVLGSKSTYLRAEIGGFKGRTLRKDDSFECGEMTAAGRLLFQQLKATKEHVTWSVNYKALVNFKQTQTIRVLAGTEFDRFDKKSKDLLFNQSYTVTTQADRMGYRLEGAAPLSLTEQFELLSEGVTFGTVQVPSNGQPIVLMADRQTTGGYPKIGQVISADLSSLAQLQPTATIQFQKVTLEEAQNELMHKERLIEEIKKGIQLKSNFK